MLKQTAITVASDGYAVANHERMTALVKILIKRGVGDMINLTHFCYQSEEYRPDGSKRSIQTLIGLCCC